MLCVGGWLTHSLTMLTCMYARTDVQLDGTVIAVESNAMELDYTVLVNIVNNVCFHECGWIQFSWV